MFSFMALNITRACAPWPPTYSIIGSAVYTGCANLQVDDPDNPEWTQGTLQKLSLIQHEDKVSELERDKKNTQPDSKGTFMESRSKGRKARGGWHAGWCCGFWWCSDWFGVACYFFFCCFSAMCPSQPPASSRHRPHADVQTTDSWMNKRKTCHIRSC